MSTAQGRFTGPDEPLIDQSPGDPQSWNLYSYVRNNPLNATDPTGQDCIYINDNDVGLEQPNANRWINSAAYSLANAHIGKACLRCRMNESLYTVGREFSLDLAGRSAPSEPLVSRFCALLAA